MLSSILGNFKTTVLKDLMGLPFFALRRIASTIFASSFVSGSNDIGDSSLPITLPIADWHVRLFSIDPLAKMQESETLLY